MAKSRAPRVTPQTTALPGMSPLGLTAGGAGYQPIHRCGYGWIKLHTGSIYFLANSEERPVHVWWVDRAGKPCFGTTNAPFAKCIVAAEVPAAVRDAIDGAREERSRRMAARRLVAIRGARVEFDDKGATITGTVIGVVRKGLAVRVDCDDGREWMCGVDGVRPSAVPAPAAAPTHPLMARWSLGKVRYGLQGMENRTWEQPLFYDGKRVGTIADHGDGGSLWVDCDRQLEQRLYADAKAWAQAHGEANPFEAYSMWQSYETDHRPKGQTSAQYWEEHRKAMAEYAKPRG